jgi:hypothetical protein
VTVFVWAKNVFFFLRRKSRLQCIRSLELREKGQNTADNTIVSRNSRLFVKYYLCDRLKDNRRACGRHRKKETCV